MRVETANVASLNKTSKYLKIQLKNNNNSNFMLVSKESSTCGAWALIGDTNYIYSPT